MPEAPRGRMSGKRALVTGAASGLGLACAERFAAEGAAIALIDLDEAALERETARLCRSGANAVAIPADVGVKADAEAAVAAAVAAFDGIDVLVSNAGINRPADFLSLSEADFDLVLRTNLKSVFLFGQAAARAMIARGGGGAIINMSSGNATMTMPGLAAYAASKGGIISLTKAMALALAPHGIRVNAIAPGTIMTPLTRPRLWDDIAQRRRILARTPIGLFGDPADVAGAAVFLAGADAAYITGETLTVDGGRSALNYTIEPV